MQTSELCTTVVQVLKKYGWDGKALAVGDASRLEALAKYMGSKRDRRIRILRFYRFLEEQIASEKPAPIENLKHLMPWLELIEYPFRARNCSGEHAMIELKQET